MIDLWPWFVMSIGIVALFVYRYVRSIESQHAMYAHRGLHNEDVFLGETETTNASSSPISISGHSTQVAGRDLLEDVASARDVRKMTVRAASVSAIGHEWMPVAISLLVLLSALFVILSNNSYADAQQKWAFGAVGTILGYWFKR